MKLQLGANTNIATELDFTFFKTTGKFKHIENHLVGHIDKIGVYSSGGLDSTALLCLILSELKATGQDFPVTCFTITKSDGPTYYATRIIQKVEEHFGVTVTHVNNMPNDPVPDLSGNIGGNAIQAIKNYAPNMLIYMGINRMAPDDIKPFPQTLKIDYGHQKVNSSYISPFLFLHKPQILDIYYQLGCESLIPYTHTCTVQEVGACGKCYSCAERKWAFDVLGKIDPGTLPV